MSRVGKSSGNGEAQPDGGDREEGISVGYKGETRGSIRDCVKISHSSGQERETP